MSKNSKFYEKSLILIKHDGVSRSIVGEILSRFEKLGLKIIGMKMVFPDSYLAKKHYPVSEEWCLNVGNKVIDDYKNKNKLNELEKDFNTTDPFEIGKFINTSNEKYLTLGPVIAIVMEGPGCIKLIRKIVGSTYPIESPAGTIRGDYSWDNLDIATFQKRSIYNLIHASSSVEDAEYEINLWFKEDELFDYKISSQDYMGW
jgi:nucleoside-diphosphate kinase